MEYKYLRCNQNYQQKLDEKLKGWFFNTYNINRFILLLQKGVYLYEYMDDWEKNVMKHHYLKKKIFTVT